MKIIEADGIGVAALLAAARSIHAEIEGGNLVLGAAEIEGEAGPVAVVTALGDRYTVGVTIERNPRLVDMTDAQEPPAPARSGTTCVSEGEHYADGYPFDCICTARCCNGPTGACVCLTCTNQSHEHG